MCPECIARRKLARDALVNANMAEALGHVVKGVAEAVGLKPKTALEEEKAVKQNGKKNTGSAG